MKTFNLLAATLSLGTLAVSPTLAQETTSPATAPSSQSVYVCEECKGYYSASDAMKMNMKDSMGHTLVMMDKAPDGYRMMSMQTSGGSMQGGSMQSSGGTMMQGGMMMNMSDQDKYRMRFMFQNLDSREVKRFKAKGFTEDEIKQMGNLSLRTGVSLDYLSNRVLTSGYALPQLAVMYGVPASALNADLPGIGMDSMMMMGGGMSGGSMSGGSMSSPSTMPSTPSTMPSTPTTPSTPETPSTPSTPSTTPSTPPTTPSTPSTPTTPETPTTPSTPSTPTTPSTPSTPTTPETPSTPSTPPTTPSTPSTPSTNP